MGEEARIALAYEFAVEDARRAVIDRLGGSFVGLDRSVHPRHIAALLLRLADEISPFLERQETAA